MVHRVRSYTSGGDQFFGGSVIVRCSRKCADYASKSFATREFSKLDWVVLRAKHRAELGNAALMDPD